MNVSHDFDDSITEEIYIVNIETKGYIVVFDEPYNFFRIAG